MISARVYVDQDEEEYQEDEYDDLDYQDYLASLGNRTYASLIPRRRSCAW